MWVGGQLHAPGTLLPGKRPGTHCTGGWVGPRVSLDGCGKSRPPTGIRSPDSPARSESLYRLSYRGSYIFGTITICEALIRNTRYTKTRTLLQIKKNPPGRKILGRKMGHVRGKVDVWQPWIYGVDFSTPKHFKIKKTREYDIVRMLRPKVSRWISESVHKLFKAWQAWMQFAPHSDSVLQLLRGGSRDGFRHENIPASQPQNHFFTWGNSP